MPTTDERISDVVIRLEAVRRGVALLLERDRVAELAAGFHGDENGAVLYALLVSGLREQLDQVADRLPCTVSRC